MTRVTVLTADRRTSVPPFVAGRTRCAGEACHLSPVAHRDPAISFRRSTLCVVKYVCVQAVILGILYFVPSADLRHRAQAGRVSRLGNPNGRLTCGRGATLSRRSCTRLRSSPHRGHPAVQAVTSLQWSYQCVQCVPVRRSLSIGRTRGLMNDGRQGSSLPGFTLAGSGFTIEAAVEPWNREPSTREPWNLSYS